MHHMRCIIATLFIVAVSGLSTSLAQSYVWDHPEGQACFEEWMIVFTSTLNGYDGNAQFNQLKPWSFSPYGHGINSSLVDYREPDDWFGYLEENKYKFMWGPWNKRDLGPDFTIANETFAGLQLRYYVQTCLAAKAMSYDANWLVTASTPVENPTDALTALDPDANCPSSFSMHNGSTLSILCYCNSGTSVSSIWGTGIYTSDSGICNAAIHAGAIDTSGGMVLVKGAKGQASYTGTMQNGVSSKDFGSYSWSFFFPTFVSEPRSPNASPAPPGPQADTDVPACLTDLNAYDETDEIKCSCTADAANANTDIYGTEIYTSDSNICRAALHAGAIDSGGGIVFVRPLPGRDNYPSSSQNGITSNRSGPWTNSFSFETELIFVDDFGQGDFSIRFIEYGNVAISDGDPGEALFIYWNGTPSFPLSVTLRPRTCPAGLDCGTRVFDIASPENPIIVDGYRCRGISTSTTFDSEILLHDANGRTTETYSTPWTCLASGSTLDEPETTTATTDWAVNFGDINIVESHIETSPPSDGSTSMYIAPSRFLGDWSSFSALYFDKRSSGGSYYIPSEKDVVLKNGNLVARYVIAEHHDDTWHSYTVPLFDEGWTLEGGADSLLDVLINVTEFHIRAEYGDGVDRSALANVKRE